MKFHQFVYFLETAKQQHIGKAAKVLAITPSAISHSIAALEEELGRPLFSREGKHISLTNHGKLLYQRVSRLLIEVDAIKEELTSEDVELSGMYKLAASHVLASELMTPAWSLLQANNPKLVAEIYQLRSARVARGVSTGEFDFGICFSPQSSPTIQTKVLYEGQLIIALRKGHPVLKTTKNPIVELSRYTATLPKAYQGIDNCETHPVFEKFSLFPTVDLVFDSYEVAIQKIKTSNTWGFMPDWIANRSGLRILRPEGWDAPVNISALWPRNRPPTRVLNQLVTRLTQEFASPPLNS